MDIERLKKAQEALEKLNHYKQSKEALEKLWSYKHDLTIYVGRCSEPFRIADENLGERVIKLISSLLDEKIEVAQSEFDLL